MVLGDQDYSNVAANGAAQAYFNSFPPEEQTRIRASWGGSDRLQEWFDNAVAAGATDSTGTRRQGQGQGQVVAPGSTAPGGSVQSPNPQWLRWYSASNKWGEDFQRFDDNTLQYWLNNYWDPAAGKFRSEAEPEGENWGAVFEKPSEVAAGWTFHGNKAVRWSDMPAWAGGPGGQAQGSAAAPAAASQTPQDPLASGLQEQFKGQKGIFGNTNPFGPTSRTLGNPFMLSGQMLEGGGQWWGQQGYNEGGQAPAALDPVKVGNESYELAKATGAAVGQSPAASTFTPAAFGIGTEAATSPLSQAVSEQFKKRQQTPQWWSGI